MSNYNGLAERVRYGRVDNVPKNTLVTLCDGDTIYFGIARCRMEADRPNKAAGKELARRRAQIAASNVAGSWSVDGTLFVHKSQVFGKVNVAEMKKLLDYFESIDKHVNVWPDKREA